MTTEVSEKAKVSILVDLIVCLIIITVLYFQSLNRPWIFYDERLIYDELAIPIPNSFSEIFEIIGNFGLVNNISSTNYLYSSNSINRPSILGVPFLLTLGFFFKKNVLLYHCLNLFIHLINTSLVYLILRVLAKDFNLINRISILLLTLIWAAHPAQTESVLLTTNIGANLSYSVFFLLFYDFIKNKEKNNSNLRIGLLPFCFLLPMLLNEYIVALPLILFVYSFITHLKTTSFKDSLKPAWTESKPYFIGLFLYIIYFLFSNYRFFPSSLYNPLVVFFERIFWLSPQIFVHFLKVVLYPRILSIDQTSLVPLGKSLFDVYSVFSFLFLCSWLLLPVILFKWKKETYHVLLLCSLFFISILPFSQALSPTYCLFAERYLYTPLFFIVFGICGIISSRAGARLAAAILIILSVLLVLCLIRSYNRTFDWKDNITLLESTIKSNPNVLYKGLRTYELAQIITAEKPEKKPDAEKYFTVAQSYFKKAIKQFKTEKKKYQNMPLILKSYGLDCDSLSVKSVYYIAFDAFNKGEENTGKYLRIFTPYLKYYNNFDPRTLELYANLLLKNNQQEKAKEVFLDAYKKFPASSFILISLIRFEREISLDALRAKKYLREALSLFPYSKDILFEAIRNDQAEKNLLEYTRHCYLYGLRTKSKFHYLESLTGYLIMQDLNKAQHLVDKLLNLYPKDPRTLYLSSSYYIKKRDYEKALKCLNQAYLLVKSKTEDLQLAFDITNTIANLYIASGNAEQGKLFANESLKFANNNPDNIAKIKKISSQAE